VSTPKLSLTGNKPAEVTALAVDTLVVGTIQGPDGPSLAPGAEAVDEALDGRLLDLLVTLGATGKADEVVKLPTLGKLAATVVLAAGLGKPAAGGVVLAEQVRRASGAAARAMAGVKRAGTVLSTIDLGAAVEGVVLGAYRSNR
jgi:leucyl aminopeptidase